MQNFPNGIPKYEIFNEPDKHETASIDSSVSNYSQNHSNSSIINLTNSIFLHSPNKLSPVVSDINSPSLFTFENIPTRPGKYQPIASPDLTHSSGSDFTDLNCVAPRVSRRGLRLSQSCFRERNLHQRCKYFLQLPAKTNNQHRSMDRISEESRLHSELGKNSNICSLCSSKKVSPLDGISKWT